MGQDVRVWRSRETQRGQQVAVKALPVSKAQSHRAQAVNALFLFLKKNDKGRQDSEGSSKCPHDTRQPEQTSFDSNFSCSPPLRFLFSSALRFASSSLRVASSAARCIASCLRRLHCAQWSDSLRQLQHPKNSSVGGSVCHRIRYDPLLHLSGGPSPSPMNGLTPQLQGG